MVIIIDAYNLIKQISGQDFIEEGLRQRFIDRLWRYARAKSLEILLVFDGGDGFQYTKKPVTVFYSGPTESADDLIQELLDNFAIKALQSQILLVTCDRELLNIARDSNIESVPVKLFYSYLLDFENSRELVKVKKIDQANYQIYSSSTPELNKLMLAEELNFTELEIKERAEKNKNQRQSHGQAVSKYDRQLKKKINKL